MKYRPLHILLWHFLICAMLMAQFLEAGLLPCSKCLLFLGSSLTYYQPLSVALLYVAACARAAGGAIRYLFDLLEGTIQGGTDSRINFAIAVDPFWCRLSNKLSRLSPTVPNCRSYSFPEPPDVAEFAACFCPWNTILN